MNDSEISTRPSLLPAKVSPVEFRRMLSSASDLAFVSYSAEGKIVLFNRGAERLFGYRAEVVVGFSNYELLHDREHLAFFFEDEKFVANSTQELEVNVMTRSGDLLPARMTLYKLSEAVDGAMYYALYRNLSELAYAIGQAEELRQHINQNAKQSEKEAEFLREMLRHTVDTIQIGLAVLQFDSSLVAYVNDGFERITGLKNIELMGRSIEDVLASFPEAQSRLGDLADRIRRSARGEVPPPGNAVWELDFPSGKRTVEVYGRSTMVEGHDSQYILLIMEDHTERQRLQMQLVQSEKLAAIGQLAAGIAHEMRNPLNTIYSALFDLNEILKDPAPDVQDDISISMEEIKRVHEIINNLLDFARESERSTGRTNLNQVITRTVRLVQHDLSNKKIQIESDMQDVPPVAINNNALKQILINLITNAADAMPTGGKLSIRTYLCRGKVPLHMPSMGTPHDAMQGTIIRLAEISSHHSRDFSEGVYAAHAVVEISDTGHGIPPAILRNIFNPFFTTKPPGSGTGLGLSVVHSLIQDVGGATSVKSQEGAGTTFRIELPVLNDEEFH